MNNEVTAEPTEFQKVAAYCHNLCVQGTAPVAEMQNVSIALNFLQQIASGVLVVSPAQADPETPPEPIKE